MQLSVSGILGTEEQEALTRIGSKIPSLRVGFAAVKASLSITMPQLIHLLLQTSMALCHLLDNRRPAARTCCINPGGSCQLIEDEGEAFQEWEMVG